MASESQALKALKRKLGAAVSVEDEALRRASMDSLRLSILPEAVVFPRSESDIRQTLLLANKWKKPVTARGAGSSTTGSACPAPGGWALDLSGWTKARIDADASMAWAQAGATLGKIHAMADKAGLFFAPDPGSRNFATVGGAVACNAGGLRGGKYGSIRDYVASLEGFLPTGEKVVFGRALRKDVCGFNMRDLWIGSEGMLGSVSAATLKLLPRPEAKWTALCAFADESAALKAARALLSLRLRPSALEFLDRLSVECCERLWERPVFAKAPGSALLLVELDGRKGEVEEDARAVRSWAKEGASVWREAADGEDADALWNVRRSCSQAMFQLGPHKLNEDVVVPPDKQEALLRLAKRIHRETGLPAPVFGHAADGNFHVHIMCDRADKAQAAKASAAIEKLMREVVRMGGSITGEHGIGLAKSPFLRLQASKAEIAAMQAVKRALDPNNILNPDKVFKPVKVWSKPVESVRFPWDKGHDAQPRRSS